jgi:glutathione synthase
MAKSLQVAVQMDALESINVAGDSSLALMLEAQSRGARIFHYLPDQLDWVEEKVVATARPVELMWPPAPGEAHFRWLGEPRQVDLAAEIDVVLLRQDPPFDMAYITSTHLLERARDAGVLVVNDPTSVRNAPEKLFVLNYADLMPPTLVTRSLQAAQAFRAKHREVVVKPLYGNAGAAVFHVPEGDSNLPALVELFGEVWREPFMVQAFLPEVAKGDKRIVLIDGEPAGAINRLPKDGEIRSNLAAGGSAHATELTPEERAICARLGPDMRRLGLVFVGIDVIAGRLTEINVTSPTGIRAIDRFNGTNIPGHFWDRVQARLVDR